MGKSVENPKRYIISCRVSDQEMEALQDLARQSGTNISNFLRRSLNLTGERSDCGSTGSY